MIFNPWTTRWSGVSILLLVLAAMSSAADAPPSVDDARRAQVQAAATNAAASLREQVLRMPLSRGVDVRAVQQLAEVMMGGRGRVELLAGSIDVRFVNVGQRRDFGIAKFLRLARHGGAAPAAAKQSDAYAIVGAQDTGVGERCGGSHEFSACHGGFFPQGLSGKG